MSSAEAKIVPAEDHLDLVFRALGDRTRRNLLSRLADGPAMVTELAEPFDMSLPAVGKHLRVLEKAGLVRRTVSGRVHQCSLNALPLKTAEQWLVDYQRFWEETLDGLIEHIQNDADQSKNG
ncbi:MAG: metalloregulator ArsR/SmtB family transcription factor [Gammaproteobacteria bacterium]|nr:metalloregulator ArsR/SmtB family transcription factor [Gammaproteobacteria bacterium]